VCKIGKTDNYVERLNDHVRRTYRGFVPYVEFTTGKAIATIFKIRNFDMADTYIKEMFDGYQIRGIEIYNLDYDEIIKQLYTELKRKNVLIELIKDGYSLYDFVEKMETETSDTTTKKNFEEIKNQIILKYQNNFPEELQTMLRDKKDFIENCNSHYKTGNYIDFGNEMILDLNYNKSTRLEILNKLRELV